MAVLYSGIFLPRKTSSYHSFTHGSFFALEIFAAGQATFSHATESGRTGMLYW